MRCGLDFSLYGFRNVSQIVWFDNGNYGVQELRFRTDGQRIYGDYACGSYSCQKRHALISSPAQPYTDLRRSLCWPVESLDSLNMHRRLIQEAMPFVTLGVLWLL